MGPRARSAVIDTVKLGSMGIGWWGNVLADGVAASGVAEVVGCFSRTPATREAFAAKRGCVAFESYEEMLASDIEGVLLATSHSSHIDQILQAAAAGKHVFVDKPLTLTVEDADRAIAAAEAAGIVLQVGHNRRRLPANRKIKEMIDSGEFGTVQHFDGVHTAPMLFKPDLPAWRQRRDEIPAGGMTPLGVHQLDSFLYLGGPITRVSAFSKQLMPELGELDDTTIINFEFASGATGSLFTSVISGPIVDLMAHGSERVAWNKFDGGVLEILERGNPTRHVVDLPALDTIADQLVEFAGAIRGEATPETGGAEGRAVVEILEAVVASAAAGGAVVDLAG
jgi:predicted dehydrogenase